MENIVKKIWKGVKNPLKTFAALACFGVLPSSCRNKSQQDCVPVKDMLYYAQNNIPMNERDICGNSVQARVVEIRIYGDASMNDKKGGVMHQMRWGVPAKELPEVQRNNQKTHAEFVYLDEVSQTQGWIEVFDNEYGISVSKDQPCFLVDKSGRLRLIGNQKNYKQNMRNYWKTVKEDEEKARLRAEQNRRYYMAKQQTWDEKQIKLLKSQGINVVEDKDSLVQDSSLRSVFDVDSTVRDSLKEKALSPDSVIVRHPIDSIRMDTVLDSGR